MLPGGSGSTVAVSVKHSIPVTLAKKEGASVRMENCANLTDSLPNLIPFHSIVECSLYCSMSPTQLALTSNTDHFLAIQTCVCMQWQNFPVQWGNDA